MNERIEIEDDDELVIQRHEHACCITPVVIRDNGLFIGEERFDDDGLRALIDVANCKLQTGSFAALADTSDIPWTGKRMRYVHGDNHIGCQILRMDFRGGATVLGDNGYMGWASKLLPLTPAPPKPKWRAMKPREAIDHLGREFVTKSGKVRVELIGENGIYQRAGWWLGFNELLCCTWADDGTPCGTPED
jgi:hypothetical protein